MMQTYVAMTEKTHEKTHETHQVDLSDLLDWTHREMLLYAKSGQKALYATLYNKYEIWHKGQMIFETSDPRQAVNVYNAL
jgi:hypothetical protein